MFTIDIKPRESFALSTKVGRVLHRPTARNSVDKVSASLQTEHWWRARIIHQTAARTVMDCVTDCIGTVTFTFHSHFIFIRRRRRRVHSFLSPEHWHPRQGPPPENMALAGWQFQVDACKTLPLPCVSTAFVAKTVLFVAAQQGGCRRMRLAH